MYFVFIPNALKAGFILGAAFAAAFAASGPPARAGLDTGGVLDALLPVSDITDLLSLKVDRPVEIDARFLSWMQRCVCKRMNSQIEHWEMRNHSGPPRRFIIYCLLHLPRSSRALLKVFHGLLETCKDQLFRCYHQMLLLLRSVPSRFAP